MAFDRFVFVGGHPAAVELELGALEGADQVGIARVGFVGCLVDAPRSAKDLRDDVVGVTLALLGWLAGEEIGQLADQGVVGRSVFLRYVGHGYERRVGEGFIPSRRLAMAS